MSLVIRQSYSQADLTALGFPTTFTNLPSDSDDDTVPDSEDNCPDEYNPLQENADGDLLGDAVTPTMTMTAFSMAQTTAQS